LLRERQLQKASEIDLMCILDCRVSSKNEDAHVKVVFLSSWFGLLCQFCDHVGLSQTWNHKIECLIILFSTYIQFPRQRPLC
jgi:hypothetical protein